MIEALGVITMLTAFAGFAYIYFGCNESSFLIRSVSALFFITGCFGIATLNQQDLDYILYPLRIIIMAFVVYSIYYSNHHQRESK